MTSTEIRSEWSRYPCTCGHPNRYRCADPLGDNALAEGCRCGCHDYINALYATHQPEPVHVSVAVAEFMAEIGFSGRREAS